MKIQYRLSVLLLLIFMSTSLVFGQIDLLKKADKAYELGDYRKAITNYKTYLKGDDSKKDLYGKIGNAYFQLFELDQSEYWYAKLPEALMHPDYQLAYANVLKMRGNYTAAKKWYRSYAKYNPSIGNHFANSCDKALEYQAQESLFKVRVDRSNTNTSDFAPAFYKDDLVYASSRGDVGKVVAKNWTGNKYNYLFKAKIGAKGALGNPTYYHGALTDFDKNEGPISFSKDGKWVAFCKNKYVNGRRQLSEEPAELDLFIAEVDAEGEWQNAVAFPHNNGAYSTGWPFLSEDGSTLYFSSNMPIIGKGGYDIYISKKIGDTWTAPENLGSKINSPGNEISPFKSGGELYFSSDWHAGMGGLDVFKVIKKNGVWEDIYHLGNGINSAQDDYNWIYDEGKGLGYFVSNRSGGMGKEDIYSFSKSAQEIEITVLNATDRRPVSNVKLDFSQCGGNIEKTDNLGAFAFHALDGYSCALAVSKNGFKTVNRTISKGNSTAKRKIEILLLNTKELFEGKVLSRSDRSGINNVSIKLTNQKTGQIAKTNSDGYGLYQLALKPNNRYIIKYSKSGYTETSRLLETRNIVPSTQLGEYSMLPIGYQETDVVATTTSTSPRPKLTPSAKTEMVLTEPDKVLFAQTEKSYAVQVMSIKANSSKLPNFEKLSHISEVYTVELAGMKKFRLGPFDTRAAASAAAKRIKKKGYKNFVVEEEGGLRKEVIHGLTARGGAVPSTAAKSIPVNEMGYKLQLGVFKNPDNFDIAPLKPFGTIEKKKRADGLTVILLTGYNSIETAKSMLGRVNYLGYKKAFLVKEENGEILP